MRAQRSILDRSPEVQQEGLDRIVARVDIRKEGCWLWTGAQSGARMTYGRLYLLGQHYPAHRALYELTVERVPPELPLDHLCRVTLCVNPDHLEPVTDQVNVSRGMVPTSNRQRGLAKTHCAQGHEYTPENTMRDVRGHRRCAVCNRERVMRWRQERKVA